ncbi:MAG: molybdopterin cofactor-binding domain-containing protein [Pseudomonadota bacterium]
MSGGITRRSLLQSAIAGAALTIGINAKGVFAQGLRTGAKVTPFVKVYSDGTVAAIIKHFEGGQGTATGLSALIAEEMNMSLQNIAFEMAPSDVQTYANLGIGVQVTGGSTAMANSFLQYRTAAAAAREMLLSAAADAWSKPLDKLELKNGFITAGERSESVGAFVAAASELEVPSDPSLKPVSEWQVIGRDQKARLDTPAKTNGSAIYSMDMQLKGQMVAAIKRSPRLDGMVASFDDNAARAVPGFIMAKRLPNDKGVLAYAENTWAAFQARDLIEVDWDFSAAERRSTEEQKEDLLAKVRDIPEYQASEAALSDVTSSIAGAAQVVEREFYFPLLAHAPMETLGATIEPTENGGLILHDGAQSPTVGHSVLSQILDIPMEKIQVNSLYAGGFFGRRLTPDSDYLVETALAFAVTDRTRPVKLQWSREDDITGGNYRPSYAHRVRVGLDEEGRILGWDHRVAGQSIFKGSSFQDFFVRDGVDATSIEGIHDTVYRIPVHHVGLTDQKGPTTPNWWRSVGHNHTAYVMECMMDLCAAAAGKDPVEYRLDRLQGDGPDQTRMKAVIRLAAEKAGWGRSLPAGHFQGIAAHKSFGTYVAQVCEISLDQDGAVKIEKFTAAVDCGIAVTPDIVRAQIEGGIGYGVGHVMRAGLTLENGAVTQSNFHDYETLRIYDLSRIETHIVPSDAPPSGVGEPGTPPAGPALANAIAAAGKPMTTFLPMTSSGIEFA